MTNPLYILILSDKSKILQLHDERNWNIRQGFRIIKYNYLNLGQRIISGAEAVEPGATFTSTQHCCQHAVCRVCSAVCAAPCTIFYTGGEPGRIKFPALSLLFLDWTYFVILMCINKADIILTTSLLSPLLLMYSYDYLRNYSATYTICITIIVVCRYSIINNNATRRILTIAKQL